MKIQITTSKGRPPATAGTPAALRLLSKCRSNKGDVVPPHFLPASLKINTDMYLDLLNNVMKPWMDHIAAERPYIWQQDGAPAHNSNRTLE